MFSKGTVFPTSLQHINIKKYINPHRNIYSAVYVVWQGLEYNRCSFIFQSFKKKVYLTDLGGKIAKVFQRSTERLKLQTLNENCMLSSFVHEP